MSTKRKLREHKGWRYDPSARVFRHKKHGFEFVCAVGVCNFDVHFTDDDHAALMDLKANPYEKTPTLEEVVQKWWGWGGPATQQLCAMIRAAFPHIDTPPETDA